jgi:hypothetical protein
MNALNISLSPGIDFNNNQQQYVTEKAYNTEPRYITASINQTTYSMTIRVAYVITPNLTVEYWGQPYISTGEYTEFKRITEASAENYADRFHTFTDSEIEYKTEIDPETSEIVNSWYDVDENTDGTVDYSFSNPNFNFAQFRSNMVLRWEYSPGSTLFLVWTQNRNDFASVHGDNSFSHLSQSLFDRTPHNIFLIKYTYRFRF